MTTTESHKKASKKYYQKNKEKISQWHKNNYQKNKEKILKRGKKYCEENREKRLRTLKRYAKTHREQEQQRAKKNYAKNGINIGFKRYFQLENINDPNIQELFEFYKNRILLIRAIKNNKEVKNDNSKFIKCK